MCCAPLLLMKFREPAASFGKFRFTGVKFRLRASF